MKEENNLRPIGTKFKVLSEPIPYSNEIRKRCIEWEVINHILLEEIKMISCKIKE